MDPREDEFHEIDDISSIAAQLQRPIQPLIHAEQLRQAKIAFDVGLTMAILGTSLLFGGIGAFLYRGFGPASGITTVEGTIMDVLSLFLMRFLGQTVTRLNEIRRDENAMVLVGQITDPGKRDEAISELIRTFGKKPQKS
jgi:HAMP domain-containing protein